MKNTKRPKNSTRTEPQEGDVTIANFHKVDTNEVLRVVHLMSNLMDRNKINLYLVAAACQHVLDCLAERGISVACEHDTDIPTNGSIN
jgi:hypothetical protein